MEYTSKYKAEEIEAIIDAKNNTGEAVDGRLDGLFVDALQTKDVELSESAEITPDAGYLGLKQVNVTVKGGDAPSGGSKWKYYDVSALDFNSDFGSLFAILCHLVKQRQLGTGDIQFANSMGLYEGTPIMVAILLDYPTPKNLQSLGPTCGAMLETLPPDMATMIPEITEEQFYTI